VQEHLHGDMLLGIGYTRGYALLGDFNYEFAVDRCNALPVAILLFIIDL